MEAKVLSKDSSSDVFLPTGTAQMSGAGLSGAAAGLVSGFGAGAASVLPRLMWGRYGRELS